MTFCWKCPTCGTRTETRTNEPPTCSAGDHAAEMGRDYRAEAVGIGSGVRNRGDGAWGRFHPDKRLPHQFKG